MTHVFVEGTVIGKTMEHEAVAEAIREAGVAGKIGEDSHEKTRAILTLAECVLSEDGGSRTDTGERSGEAAGNCQVVVDGEGSAWLAEHKYRISI